MENYFLRQIELWGEDTQNSLKSKHIAIIGCGGLGCSLAIALGSSGIGNITLVDFDEVGIHNIHRQIAFTLDDNGKKKSKVLKQLLLKRFNDVLVDALDMDFDGFIDYSNQNKQKYDLILDATDNLPTRAKINNFSKEKSIPWIYGSVEKFHGQVCFFDKSSFEDVFQISNRTPDGIAAPIVINIASLQANLALRYLTNLSVKKDFLYYCFFDNEGIFKTQNFSLPTT
jgi:adenylyltransferase/sulfurtransferase